MSTEMPVPATQTAARFHGWLSLSVFLFLAIAAAWLGSQFTGMGRDTWYALLVKPSWNPPNWLFGLVWTLLYALMAIAAWWVWRSSSLSENTAPLTLYALQLVLNVMWSGIFFGLHRPGAALIEIVLLWTAVLFTMLAFWRRDQKAGLLFVPYLAWVSFATVLNAALWRLNP